MDEINEVMNIINNLDIQITDSNILQAIFENQIN